MRTLFKLFKYLFCTLLICIFCGVGFMYYAYQEVIPNYAIDDTILSVRATDTYVPLSEISTTFLDAIVAVEDREFYKHSGLDFSSLGRAFITNIYNGEIKQGGSTITQQLAKNLFLDSSQNLSRKVKEVCLTHYLESHYSKQDILELYVNVIYYGDNNTGIYEASTNYFNKLPSELNFNEATMLAGFPQAPSYYSANTAAALVRQTQVISALTEYSDTYDDLARSY